jgi:hypothetical protein
MCIHMKQCHMAICMSLKQKQNIFSRKQNQFYDFQVEFNMVWDGSSILSRINSNLKELRVQTLNKTNFIIF